jgi:tRNA(Ile)-lysidine synthase
VIELAIREVVTEENGRYYINIQKLKMFSPLEHVLYEIVAMFGFRQDDVPNIINAMEGIPGKKFLSPSCQLLIDRDNMIISGIKQQEMAFDIFIDEDLAEITRPLPLSFEKRDAEGFSIPDDPNIAALDLEKLQFPLILRKWEQGDGFVPLGMKNRKKLSDFFIDEKISVVDKESIWVICSGDEIAWIIGHRIADPFKITTTTKYIFLITLS